MCIFFKTMENKHAKTGEIWERGVTIKCGMCPECRRARANEWTQRIDAEIRNTKDELRPRFITFTFDDNCAKEHGIEDLSKAKYGQEDRMVKDEVRKWAKRMDSKKAKQKHWFITEHGQEGTERIHVHGIVWADKWDIVEECWKAGIVDLGEIRGSTMPYLIKYIYKEPQVKKDYKPIILTTPGIGKCYVNEYNKRKHRWRREKTNEWYVLENGKRIPIGEYYRNKFWNEEDKRDRRKWLWLKQKKWVGGIEYDTSTDEGWRMMYEKINYEQTKITEDIKKIIYVPKKKQENFGN